MMQRMVNVEVKISLQSSAIVQNADFCYFKSYCFSYISALKMQIQGSPTKKSYLKKSKGKN